jgi:ribosomal protein L40E
VSWCALQVEDLARISFKNKPLYVGVDDTQQAATREGLEQGYCCVPIQDRLRLLFTFLKKNLNKKVCGLCVAAWPQCAAVDRACRSLPL